jgi:hypothetical protein
VPITSRRHALVAIAAAICVSVSACTTPTPRTDDVQTPEPTSDATVAPDLQDATELVGLWRVTGAEGAGPETWLRLGVGLDVWSDCGHVDGAWRAAEGLFVAGVSGSGDGLSCFGDVDALVLHPSVAWVQQVTSFELTDVGPVLFDEEGSVIARLTVDGEPPPKEGIEPGAPELVDELLQRLALPTALPESAIATDDLEGRWLPTDSTAASSGAELDLRSDGTWTGNDGCTFGGGRWIAGEGGLLIAIPQVADYLMCEHPTVFDWMHQVARAGMVGDELTLYDASGAKLGALVRP